MSMHKIPLTPLEEEGLRLHGLPIGTPSQRSDTFRQGVAWAIGEARRLTEENEKLWVTFGKTADVLGIDTKAERKIPGTPSGVFIREIERLKADADRIEWQPIETAPKDGTHILICKSTDADGEPIVGKTFGLFVHRAAWWDFDNAWIVYNSMCQELPAFFEPTHWMPLPAPPK